MQAIISPGYINGTVNVPASKSMMQRACAAALLHHGKTIINNPGSSDDDNAALNIIKQLGAKVDFVEGRVEIMSNSIQPIADIVNCGESGLATRLFTPIIALSDKTMRIEGKGSLLTRPMGLMGKLLPQLSVGFESNNGYLPFNVRGPLQPKSITIDGSESSQYLSGLLFAYTYAAKETITIEVNNLASKPYIDLTLQVLEHFGKPVINEDYKRFIINPAQFQQKEQVVINIEADWSSAAFWLVAATLAGNITVTNLNEYSTQADKAILNVIEETGALISKNGTQITVIQAPYLIPFHFDATDCPDLFPVLAVLAACCHGESSIRGVHRLFHKESNRAESIGDMLQEYGVYFSMEDDVLVIEGLKKLETATINSYNDHRIAMAASVAALKAYGTSIVGGAECVSKSYPAFFSDLASLGIKTVLT